LASLPYFDDFDLSTVDVLLISQYVLNVPTVAVSIRRRIARKGLVAGHLSWSQSRREAISSTLLNSHVSIQQVLTLLAWSILFRDSVTLSKPLPSVVLCVSGPMPSLAPLVDILTV
jgi:hypothetical protein